jgi:hypothetical protein
VAIVTATGMATEMGDVARTLGRTEVEQTPLQREMAYLGRTLGLVVTVIATYRCRPRRSCGSTCSPTARPRRRSASIRRRPTSCAARLGVGPTA